MRLWWSRMRLKFWQSRATGGWKTASLSDWQARLDLLFFMCLCVKVLKRKCSGGPRFATNIFTTLIGLVSSPRRWSSCGSWSIRCWLLPLKAKNMKKYLCMRLQTETFFVNSIDCSSAWSGQRQYHSYHGAAFGSKGLRHLQVNNTVIIRFSDWFHLKLNIPLLKVFLFLGGCQTQRRMT